MTKPIDKEILESFVEVWKDRGVVVATVADGWVIGFTTEVLTKLLEKSKKTGKALVVIQDSSKIKERQ